MDEDQISRIILEAAIEVHRTLWGPDLLESINTEALAWELNKRGLHVEREKLIPVVYKCNQLQQCI